MELSIQDWGAIGEIVGGVAVVLTLIYLGVQLRQANNVARTSAFREIMYGFNQHCNQMFAPENVDLVIKGFNSYESLIAREKLQFDHLVAALFQHVEDSWNSQRAGLTASELMENWAWYLRERLFPYRGVRDWWSAYKLGYHPQLQEWADAVLGTVDSRADPYSIK